MQGRRHEPSEAAVSSWQILRNLGVELGELVSGQLNVRGDAGAVMRWGEGWFFELRDGGVGWNFDKHDHASIDERVQMILQIFRKPSNELVAIEDGAMALSVLPVEDG